MEESQKHIVIDAARCTGCRLCEIACSMVHHGICSTHRSRIRVHRFIDPEHYIPVVCQACDHAPCIKVCPVNARVRKSNGAVVTDDDICIGCRACLYICHLANPVINPGTGQTMTCDLCEDEVSGPWCVTACREEKALMLMDHEMLAAEKSKAQAGKSRTEKPRSPKRYR